MNRIIVILPALLALLVVWSGCDKSGGNKAPDTPVEDEVTEKEGTEAGSKKQAGDKAEDKGELAKAALGEPSATGPNGWTKRDSPEGGYSVMAPTSGTVQHGTAPTPVGEAKTTTVLYQNATDPGALMVMWMDMPVPDGTPLAVDKGLEDGRDRAVGTYNGTLTADKRIEINGNPAREFEFDATMPGVGSVHAIMRGAFRDKRIYMVGAVAQKGDKAFQKKGEDFVRSFEIHKQDGAGKAAAGKAAPEGEAR